jgi:hypothetical protein
MRYRLTTIDCRLRLIGECAIRLAATLPEEDESSDDQDSLSAGGSSDDEAKPTGTGILLALGDVVRRHTESSSEQK